MLKMYLIKWNEVSYDNMYINYYVDISLRWNVTLRKSLDQFWWAWRLTPWMMPLNWSMLIPTATAPPSSRPMAPLLGNTLWRSMWDRLVDPSLSISIFWGYPSLSIPMFWGHPSLSTSLSKFEYMCLQVLSISKLDNHMLCEFLLNLTSGHCVYRSVLMSLSPCLYQCFPSLDPGGPSEGTWTSMEKL